MSSPLAYYNENDPVAAEWLRRLIAAGLIPAGVVDERDIRDVAPAELVRFTQCHFFAGIGIWPLALRRAGWPDDRPIWTGSCPCQPFSSAGAGEGFADERHVWPHWHWLIQHVRPRLIVGEQVATKDGLGWHDLVSDDLGGIGYACGAVIISAAGFGLDWRGSAEARRLERAIRLCPDPLVARHLDSFARWADQALAIGGFHIRERQYFVGLEHGISEGLEGQRGHGNDAAGREPGPARSATATSAAGGLADRDGGDAAPERAQLRREQRPEPEHDGAGGGRGRGGDDHAAGRLGAGQDDNRRGDFDWLFCRDGEWRPVGPGTFPLADANPGRMGQLRAYGNALDAETATAFCEAVIDLVGERLAA